MDNPAIEKFIKISLKLFKKEQRAHPCMIEKFLYK